MNTKIEIVRKEITYILRVLKKLRILIIIPIILSISSYIRDNIELEYGTLISEIFDIVWNFHYDITSPILKYYWLPLSIILTLYYCRLRIGIKTRKLTMLFIIGSGLTILLILIVFETFVLDHFGKITFEKWLGLFSVPVNYIFNIFLFPFLMLKIKHIIKFNVTFFKKYAPLIIILVVYNYINNIILNIILSITNELLFFKLLENYTVDNILGNITIFAPCVTVIVYKNRKRLNLWILSLIKIIKNKIITKKCIV
ncbi:hypothetical protein FACS1894110_09690 [Spirochaetia bacterium]|nr:hypothetical protein FACS1894110_09690 [Spirochaetia bacterium]